MSLARRTYRRLRKAAKRVWSRLRLGYLRLRNLRARSSVLGTEDVLVSLTSHGQRVRTVAYAVESIAAGTVRPRQLILWLDDEKALAGLPAALQRLERRGLEIRLSPNWGPHTKYFPALPLALDLRLPLVTADDDILYPRTWLDGLCRAHASWPEQVSCYWASVITVTGDAIDPYASWSRCRTLEPTIRHFATGVSGVIYPQRLLAELAARGSEFILQAPRTDDVWLHWVALRAGVEIRQLGARPRHFPLLPGTQQQTLLAENVHDGGNDRWIRSLYQTEDVRRLAAAGAG